MSNRIKIFDTTLRDGEQSPGCSMNLHEKLEVAAQLEKLNVDVIEAGFAIASPGDFESVSEVAKLVKNATVASLSRAMEKDIDAAYNAVKHAVSPRIHTFLATSPIHMQYKLKMSEDEVVERAAAAVAYAKKYCSDIEFSAEDALRSDKAFLARVFSAVIAAGATVLNVPDTVGYSTPEEMADYITYLKNNIIGIEKAEISVHCHNDLGLAVANTLASVKAGATQIECTINGIGERAGNASLEETVMNLNTRKAYYGGAYCNIDLKQIYRASKLVQRITGVPVAPSKAIVGDNAFAHEAGIHQHGVLENRSTYEIMTPQDIGIPHNKMVLGKHSGRHAFDDRLAELGYRLTKDELDEAFARFKILADKKKVISDGDLEAVVAMKLDESLVQHYKLDNFVVNSGKNITATSTVRLQVGDSEETIEAVSSGEGGPVHASYRAINILLGERIEVEDYSIRAATEGEDAIAEVVVKLRRGDKKATGRASSTDTIEASILAYLNGVNKLWA
ncbi:MAG: 2-isopropylmalate synthase [Oscillospiraceae bacterium]|nr:2-isopropylmalate synthase [Oscillospiraceae bacterium]